MKFLFIDETLDSCKPDYMGVCAALIDSSKYGDIKRQFMHYLDYYGWDRSYEFKGSYIFSSSHGCPSVTVEKRIELTKSIVDMNNSTTNARISFCFAHTDSGSTSENYLRLVGEVSNGILQSSSSARNGKDVVTFYCDQRNEPSAEDIRAVVDPVLEKKNWVLFEDVTYSDTNVQTVGLCYADIVGYLISRIHNIDPNPSFLEDPSSEAAKRNGQFQKLVASHQIVDTIKRVKILEFA